MLDLPPGVGGMPKAAGIAGRLDAWLTKHADMPGAPFLQAMVPWAVKKFGFDPDKFVHELVDSIIGDHYPVPDRMLVHNEQVVHEYLQWAMCGNPRPKGTFKLYAVEGGTAAMCYIFKSLKSNRHSQSRRHDRARRADLHAVPRDGASGGLRPPFRRGAREAGEPVSVPGCRAQEAPRPEDQGVLHRQPGQPVRGGDSHRDDREDRGRAQEAAGSHPADG